MIFFITSKNLFSTSGTAIETYIHTQRHIQSHRDTDTQRHTEHTEHTDKENDERYRRENDERKRETLTRAKRKGMKQFGGIALRTFEHPPGATMSISGRREKEGNQEAHTHRSSPGPNKKNDVIAREFPELQHVSYRIFIKTPKLREIWPFFPEFSLFYDNKKGDRLEFQNVSTNANF